MRNVFVDSSYWIAYINPNDVYHDAALQIEPSLKNAVLITTSEVLTEVMNYFTKRGPVLKMAALKLAREIINDEQVQIIWQTQMSFLNGTIYYQRFLGTEYSFVDCSCMAFMWTNSFNEILTTDDHFSEQGFNKLLD
ncbi:MAG: type II toxin-antitoxin system VapC family toxin [Planctomycetota bacterium]|nr:MAG: type II toxin-antitoxin system VapC family toxin [Planctomycetota bacterium]